MNITINKKQSPSFGVLKLNENAAKILAKEITNNPNPAAAEKNFIENIAEPINKLKDTIICNDNRVLIKYADKKECHWVLETTMGKFAISNGYTNKKLSFFTNKERNGYCPDLKTLSFESSEEANAFKEKIRSSSPLIGDLLCAKKYMEQTELLRAQKYTEQKETSTDAVAQRLKDLYF